MNDTYTIKLINKDGSIDVTFSCDGKTQNISGAPLSDTVALDQFLTDYCNAYKAGLAIEAKIVDPAVTALIGKTITIEEV